MREWIERLQAGERNPWLVYELCKRWRPTSIAYVRARLVGVDPAVVSEVWEEYRHSGWRIEPEGLGETV